MKPHLDAAAENGNDLAICEKRVLDEELEKIIVKGNKRRRLAIDESKSNKSLSTENLSIYCFFMKAPIQVNTGIDESISPKKPRY